MKRWLILLGAVVLLLGCTVKQPQFSPRLVQSVTVIIRHGNQVDRRFFNTDEKMQVILHHIRAIGIQDTPDEDPENISGTLIEITLAFSDGTFKAYTHKGERYFREDGGPWKQIAPEKVQGLYQLLMLMEGDPEPTARYFLPIGRLRIPPISAPKILSEKMIFFKNST